MVVSWPTRIKDAGGVRHQFAHLIDVASTILDVAHIPAPESVNGVDQKPMDGVSIASTFTTPRRGRCANVSTSRSSPIGRSTTKVGSPAPSTLFRGVRTWRPGHWENDKWELYNLDKDFSEGQ